MHGQLEAFVGREDIAQLCRRLINAYEHPRAGRASVHLDARVPAGVEDLGQPRVFAVRTRDVPEPVAEQGYGRPVDGPERADAVGTFGRLDRDRRTRYRVRTAATPSSRLGPSRLGPETGLQTRHDVDAGRSIS